MSVVAPGMNTEAWITICIGLGTLVLNVVAMAIGYGVLRGTVDALNGRVRALETEIKTLGDIKVAIGEIKTSQAFITSAIVEVKNKMDRSLDAPSRRRRQQQD